MTESTLAWLGRDLRDRLSRGAVITPPVSSSGDRWLLGWALGCGLVGLTLFLFCGYHAGFSRVNGLTAAAPPWIWEWLTMLGDERVAFALTLFFSRRRPRVFWTLVAAAVVGIAFTHSLKPLFLASRPPAVLDAGTFNLIGPSHRSGSFPSGHSVTAAVFFGVWVYYLRARWLRALLILVAVAAGMSRVAVGVHWPVDVAFGLFGGALAAWLGVWLAERASWGITNPFVHLAFVAVAAVMCTTLLFDDGGYPGAALPQLLLGTMAFAYGVWTYLIDPLRRRA